MVNSVKPQSKQTTSFGNTNTAGWSRPFRPEIWTLISAPYSSWFPLPHTLQAILFSPPSGNGFLSAVSLTQRKIPNREICHEIVAHFIPLRKRLSRKQNETDPNGTPHVNRLTHKLLSTGDLCALTRLPAENRVPN